LIFIPTPSREKDENLFPSLCKETDRFRVAEKTDLKITPLGLLVNLNEKDGIYLVPFSPLVGFQSQEKQSSIQNFLGYFLISGQGEIEVQIKRPVYYFILLAQIVFLLAWCVYMVFSNRPPAPPRAAVFL